MDKDQVHQAQRRRRDFIRAHHPDRGGDPDAFIAGLQVLAADLRTYQAEADPDPLPPVFIVKRLRWPTRLANAAGDRLRPGRRPPRVR